MKLFIIAFCAWSGAASPSWAAFRSGDAGTSGAQFLEWGAGARAEAMGEAFTAVADDASALYWNPSGLSRIDAHSAILTHALLLGGVNYDYMGYGQRTESWGSFGASIQYASQPPISETDATGFATGNNFTPRNMSLSVGYALPLSLRDGRAFHDRAKSRADAEDFDAVAIGIAGKYVESTVSKSASTFAADVGFITPSYPVADVRLRLGGVVRNIGGALKFETASDPLPLTIKLGAAASWTKSWLLSVDAVAPRDDSPYAAVGGEYRRQVDPRTLIFARVGFNSRSFGDAGGLEGLTTGIGGRFGVFGADYAFSPMGALGLAHRLSLNLAF